MSDPRQATSSGAGLVLSATTACACPGGVSVNAVASVRKLDPALVRLVSPGPEEQAKVAAAANVDDVDLHALVLLLEAA